MAPRDVTSNFPEDCGERATTRELDIEMKTEAKLWIVFAERRATPFRVSRSRFIATALLEYSTRRAMSREIMK
jgi:hypothetical protein